MKIERWFQGSVICGGYQRGTTELEPDSGKVHCLMTFAVTELAQPSVAIQRMASIIERLFPGRACDCPTDSQYTHVIHFNNHPETTREDVDKVLRVYTEEMEAARDLG